MQFFDLNIPYLESDKNIPDKKTKKEVRLKTMARAAELGYSGIAFNRTIKGSMSQSDGCTIPRFPLSSLLKLHPSLSSAVSFHRRLLGVPEGVAFRQYTRLTVVVDSDGQSSALNSGNPVLKTYDLIAVRPLNQTLFDHACLSAQVDIISIDFGKRLPFRLKLSSVKAAIARDVYFEIMYSSFLEDAQVRRQMISNAKLLVEWTKGKNLIVSSSAPSSHEIRGPNDVSNLLYLLGLSNERAKAAISKNCRLLIINALRKRQFYKEAVRVEMMPAGSLTGPKEPWIVDFLSWDPLSTGDGDLLLEDLAKSFAESAKDSQAGKSIGFASVVDIVPSHGQQAGHNRTEGKFHSSRNVVDFVSTSKDLEVPNEKGEPTFVSTSLLDQKAKADELSEQSLSLIDSPDVEGFRISSAAILEEFEALDSFDATVSPVGLDAIHVSDMIASERIRETFYNNAVSDVECSISSDVITAGPQLSVHNAVQAYTWQTGSGAFNEIETEVFPGGLRDESNSLDSSDLCMGNNMLQMIPDLVIEAASTESADKIADVDSFVEKNNADGFTSGDVQHLKELAIEQERSDECATEMMNVDSSMAKNTSNGLVLGNSLCVEKVTKEHEQNEEHHPEVKTDVTESELSNTPMQVDSFFQGKFDNSSSIANTMFSEEVIMERSEPVQEFVKAEQQSLGERKPAAGSLRVKRSAVGPDLRFPFKRMLLLQSKRKGRLSMHKTKKR